MLTTTKTDNMSIVSCPRSMHHCSGSRRNNSSKSRNENTHSIAIALKQNGTPWTKQLRHFLRARQRRDRITFIPDNENLVREPMIPWTLKTLHRTRRPPVNMPKIHQSQHIGRFAERERQAPVTVHSWEPLRTKHLRHC